MTPEGPRDQPRKAQHWAGLLELHGRLAQQLSRAAGSAAFLQDFCLFPPYTSCSQHCSIPSLFFFTF